MILHLFPIPVYLDKSIDMISVGSKLFDIWPEETRFNGFFNTTLKGEYCPYKAPVTWDLIDVPEAQPLLEYIKRSAILYLKENKNRPHSVRVQNMWLNEMASGEHHPKHSHYGYSISGTFYVDVPEGSNKLGLYSPLDGVGHILGPESQDSWTTSNSMSWWIPVEAGNIILFPSHIKHEVPPMQFHGLRRSISFDLVLIPIE
jgi:uncharacterized protein (TIGR02466 family)